ncbi:unnamed protein product [Didymodactylos carnosus]|uniref:Uncharacterized protein n=1 Tax=Didymodactylos carnosus TaxID=1234261 RepID=A0A815N1K4_9BILA|nr:unnamed protein product [Didymodactylos carnosus]CAF1432120.1 unnamed protein product [Didymodactylos carnosus]CAF3761226.1 unnamed protein product [Didymodactylos carnosus]CAF4310526.1 unnamed protein product [Didymodactylos carnosus]
MFENRYLIISVTCFNILFIFSNIWLFRRAYEPVINSIKSVQYQQQFVPILYNRVPKCASTLMKMLFVKQSRLLNFKFLEAKVYTEYKLNQVEQKHFVNKLMNNSKTLTLFERHIYFIDFNRHQHIQPFYINLLRNPLERAISDYYYSRYMCTVKRKTCFRMNLAYINETLDDCIIRNENQPHVCTSLEHGVHSAIAFFCGQSSYCEGYKTIEEALWQAKSNIVKYYKLIGITENLFKTFSVMEHVLPQFFANISKLYLRQKKKRIWETPKAYRIEPNNRTKEILYKALKYEIDLYTYVKRRLDRRYDEIFSAKKKIE